MFGKTLFYGLLLLGVAVAPYLLSDTQWLGRVEDLVTRSDSTTPEDTKPKDAEANLPTSAMTTKLAANVVDPLRASPSTAPSLDQAALASVTSQHDLQARFDPPLTHLLSFQATPEWIAQNWQGITNCAGELDLRGWRVPYFRSTREDDFAGSVTYYFDRARLVQRISLHGYTSDPSQIVQIATNHYGMRRVHSPEGDLYLASVDNQPIGGLRIKLAPLLNAEKREQQCELLLELNRRNTEYGMSREFSDVVRRHREANYLLTPISERGLGS